MYLLVKVDKSISLENGAIEAWRKGGKRMNIYYNRLIKRFCRNFGIRIHSLSFEAFLIAACFIQYKGMVVEIFEVFYVSCPRSS